MSEKVVLEKKVLSENDRLAGEIRTKLKDKGIGALNFVSSPGSGKTSLLEQTIKALSDEIRFGLIAGDVQTENDANRLVAAGGKMVHTGHSRGPRTCLAVHCEPCLREADRC